MPDSDSLGSVFFIRFLPAIKFEPKQCSLRTAVRGTRPPLQEAGLRGAPRQPRGTSDHGGQQVPHARAEVSAPAPGRDGRSGGRGPRRRAPEGLAWSASAGRSRGQGTAPDGRSVRPRERLTSTRPLAAEHERGRVFLRRDGTEGRLWQAWRCADCHSSLDTGTYGSFASLILALPDVPSTPTGSSWGAK